MNFRKSLLWLQLPIWLFSWSHKNSCKTYISYLSRQFTRPLLMPSNFAFLSSEWPALHDDAVATEASILSAPRTCARRMLEKVTQ